MRLSISENPELTIASSGRAWKKDSCYLRSVEDDQSIDAKEVKESAYGLYAGSENIKKIKRPRLLYIINAFMENITHVAEHEKKDGFKKLLIEEDKIKESEHFNIEAYKVYDTVIENILKHAYLKRNNKHVVSKSVDTFFYYRLELQEKNKSIAVNFLSNTSSSKKNTAGKKYNNLKKNKIGNSCPSCKKGFLVKRNFKKDPSKPFIGCSKFPNCRFFSWPTPS